MPLNALHATATIACVYEPTASSPHERVHVLGLLISLVVPVPTGDGMHMVSCVLPELKSSIELRIPGLELNKSTPVPVLHLCVHELQMLVLS